MRCPKGARQRRSSSNVGFPTASRMRSAPRPSVSRSTSSANLSVVELMIASAPHSFTRPAFAALDTVPKTRAPATLASCTATSPTPPAAEWTSTLVPGPVSRLGTPAIDNTSGPPSSLKTMALTASLLAAKCAPTDRRAQVSNPLHPRTRPSRSRRAGRLTPTPSSCRLRAFHDGASRGCPRVPPDADRAVLRRAGLADLLYPGAHARAVVHPSRSLRAARQLDRVQRQGHRPELRRHVVHHLHVRAEEPRELARPLSRRPARVLRRPRRPRREGRQAVHGKVRPPPAHPARSQDGDRSGARYPLDSGHGDRRPPGHAGRTGDRPSGVGRQGGHRPRAIVREAMTARYPEGGSTMWRRRLVAALLVAALVVISDAAPAAALQVGDKAPDFTLPATTAEKFSLSQFQGKSNVVLFGFIGAFTPT